MVFKKKDTPEVYKSPSFEEMVNSERLYYPEDVNPILNAIRTLREAIKSGNLKSKDGYMNNVCFGFVTSEEEIKNESLQYYGHSGRELNRVKFVSSLDKIIYVDNETLLKQKKESLASKIKDLQESQKKKVEEIEKLSKQLGELE